MKLIPKYQGGSKTYQYRRFGDFNLPTNIKILDKSGLEISPNENTKILTDFDGNPINRSWLVANNYYNSPSPDTVYANTPLKEIVVTADKTPAGQKVKDFVNDEILLNKDNTRVNNMQKLLSTESGQKIQQAFADGGRDATLILSSPYWVPATLTSVAGSPMILKNAARGLYYGLKYRPIGTSAKLLIEGGAGWFGGNVGGSTVDKVSEFSTNKTFGKNVEQVLNIPSGTGDLFNPGYYVGGNFGYQLYNKPVRRAAEVVMRTSSEANPIGPMLKGINEIYKKPIKQATRLLMKGDFSGQNWKEIKNGRRAFDILKYITTGKRSPNTVYNSLNVKGNIYGGLLPSFSKSEYSDAFAPTNYKTGDYIDAFLYQKPVGIEGIKRVDDDYGIFTDYINKNYRDKVGNIPIYETDADFIPNPLLEKRLKGKDVSPTSRTVGAEGTITTSGGRDVDVGGYRLQYGNYKGDFDAVRQQDIWKFNSSDYNKKWTGNDYFITKSKNPVLKELKKLLLRGGLEIVDDLGTPIITRSPWFVESE